MVCSNDKTRRHNIAEILLKVALNTINLIPLYPLTKGGKWRSNFRSLLYLIYCLSSEPRCLTTSFLHIKLFLYNHVYLSYRLHRQPKHVLAYLLAELGTR